MNIYRIMHVPADVNNAYMQIQWQVAGMEYLQRKYLMREIIQARNFFRFTILELLEALRHRPTFKWASKTYFSMIKSSWGLIFEIPTTNQTVIEDLTEFCFYYDDILEVYKTLPQDKKYWVVNTKEEIWIGSFENGVFQKDVIIKKV